MKSRSAKIALFAGSLALGFLALTIPFWIWPLDLSVQSAFYDPELRWFRGDSPLFEFLYDYGDYPAYAVAGLAAGVFALGFARPTWAPWRRVAAYVVLCLAIGPGLIVNAVLKDHWGRPRPRDVIEFGGQDAYERPWIRDVRSTGRSFPSGHASAGFYFLAATPLLWRRRRPVALVALASAVGFGSLLGLARIAQGGHFLSDVLWSAGICALTSLGLYFALGLDRDLPGRASRAGGGAQE